VLAVLLDLDRPELTHVLGPLREEAPEPLGPAHERPLPASCECCHPYLHGDGRYVTCSVHPSGRAASGTKVPFVTFGPWDDDQPGATLTSSPAPQWRKVVTRACTRRWSVMPDGVVQWCDAATGEAAVV